MRQISKPREAAKPIGNKKKRKPTDRRLPPKQKVKRVKTHPDFGTSKAEQDFARNFLDKLGVGYVWQYEAKEIGRFFDYKLDNGILIEFQGSYYHGDSRIYEEKDLNPMQKRNRRVDEQKRQWALMHGMPLIYVWEKDVNEHPEEIMKMLRERLRVQGDVIEKENNFKKRHVNKLNTRKD